MCGSSSTSFYTLRKAQRISWTGRAQIYRGKWASKSTAVRSKFQRQDREPSSPLFDDGEEHNFPIYFFDFSPSYLIFSSQDAQGVLILNIGSYMGGVDLWQNDYDHDDDFGLQSMHDKALEIVCISGTWQLGKLQVTPFPQEKIHLSTPYIDIYDGALRTERFLFQFSSRTVLTVYSACFSAVWPMEDAHFQQVGLSQATRLGQGRVVRVNIRSPFPVQIDGEPWIQQPGCLEITHHGQVSKRLSCVAAPSCIMAIALFFCC